MKHACMFANALTNALLIKLRKYFFFFVHQLVALSLCVKLSAYNHDIALTSLSPSLSLFFALISYVLLSVKNFQCFSAASFFFVLSGTLFLNAL